MKNILDLYEYIEKKIKKSYFFKNMLNEGKINDFYEDVFKKIASITNEKILVINSVYFAEKLSNESSMNKIVCIYSDNDFKVSSDSNVEYRFIEPIMNGLKLSVDTSRDIESENKEITRNFQNQAYNLLFFT